MGSLSLRWWRAADGWLFWAPSVPCQADSCRILLMNVDRYFERRPGISHEAEPYPKSEVRPRMCVWFSPDLRINML